MVAGILSLAKCVIAYTNDFPVLSPSSQWTQPIDFICSHHNGCGNTWWLSHPGIPGVTLCFCTGSHAVATAAAPAAGDHRFLVHAITFEQLFGFFHFWHNCWHWPIDYLIRFWSWHWPWIFKVKYRICYISAKNGAISTKRKANISIDLKTSNVTIGFDIGHDLDLEFSSSNMELAISLPKMVLPRNERKHIDWTLDLKCDQWVWPWPWPWYLNFQGHIWSWPFGDQGQV